ncbi:MAG: GIY-YIG nuclease family protein [Chloroflexota bacterium]|nr:GIY-YIG nuclease family protein [Chloroflexota bacterium]
MIPEKPGTYVLLLRLPHPATVDVGQLGRFQFSAGWYAYAGSALGPGGLAARVGRHRRGSKSLHWHIDYVRAHADAVAVWYTVGWRRQECVWAEALCEIPDASIPAYGLGASDCRCPTHLVHFPTAPDRSHFSAAIGRPVCEELVHA